MLRPGLIKLKDNLAVIDYSQERTGGDQAAIERCPTGAIVWFDDAKGPIKESGGEEDPAQQPLPLMSVQHWWRRE